MLSASPVFQPDIQTPSPAQLDAPLAAQLDVTPLAATTPAAFSLIDPPGSLVGQFSTSGEITEANSIDDVTLTIEEGQRLTVVLEPEETLQSTIRLLNGVGTTVLQGTASALGDTLVIQSFLIANTGNYSVTVEGAAETLGAYDLRFYLNAAIELESLGADPNSTLAAAENLNASFVSLGGAEASRAAVVGTRGIDLEEDFESGMLNAEWSTSSSAAEGQVRVSSETRAAEGEFSLIMDVSKNGTENRNEADWMVNLADVTDATLRFFHTEFNDEETLLPNSFSGSANGDGVSISEDGVQWFTVWQAANVPFGTWTEVTVDLSGAASLAEISLDEEFFIRFQQFGTGAFGTDGRGFDAIQIETTPALEFDDWYRFTLEDGQATSILFDSESDPRGSLELYDAGQTLLATSSSAQNVDQMLQNFVDTTVDGSANEYFVRVVDPADEYVLLVTRDATFDKESNSSFANGQDLGAAQESIGSVSDQTGASLNLIDTFPGPDFTGFVPPDPILAAGPSQLVTLVNTEVAIYDKATGEELFSQSLSSTSGFFGSVGATATVFDPWVIYDDDSQRFFIVAIDVAQEDESSLFLAVSTSSSPSSGTDWHKYRLDVTHQPEPLNLGLGPHFPDYEKLGVNDDAVFISGNYFPIDEGTGIYAGITAIEKSALLEGAPVEFLYQEYFNASSVFPLNQFDSGGTQYFAEAIGGDTIRLHAITDVLTSPVRETFDLTVPAYASPVSVPQLGGATPADAVGSRVMTGVWRDGSAWFAHGILDPAIGDGENVVRWYEVATNNYPAADPVLIQSGNVDPGPDVHAWMPAIAVDGAANMAIGFSLGGPNQYFGAGFTGRLATDPLGDTVSPVSELVAGGGSYALVSGSRNRWGDYTGLVVDPSDDTTFWVLNEYATTSGTWDTRIGSFQVDPIPDSDFYSVFVNGGDQLVIETSTPFDGPQDLINTLDPRLELIAPDGTTVDSDDNAGTGNNALITHTADQTGEYRVRVVAGGGQGTYVLQIDGASGTTPAPRVLNATPDNGQLLNAFPVVARVEFSEPILATTVTADDLTVNGTAALSVSIQGAVLEFVIDPAVEAGNGVYTIELPAGSVSDYEGKLLADAFSTTFELDVEGPQISATRWNGVDFPISAQFEPGSLVFEADLTEDLFVLASARRGPRAPGVDDVNLIDNTSGDVRPEDSISYDSTADRFSAGYDFLPEGDYTLVLASGKGAFEDLAGNPLDGEPIGANIDGTPTGDGTPGGEYRIDFIVDVDVVEPQFVNVGPLGSLISTSLGNVGFVHDLSDLDAFRFFAEAGETVSALVTLDSEVTASLEIIGPVTISPPVSSAEPGGQVILPSTLIPLDGFYELRVAADGITHYDLDIIRNASYEQPIGDSADGNELPIDDSFVDLGSGRFGVLGNSQRKLEFDFYNEPEKFVDISDTGIPTNLTDDGELTTTTTVGNEIFPDGIITIANNGGIVAGIGSNVFFQNLPLPAPDIGRSLFPYWDDLDDLTGNVYYQELDVEGVPTLIVQWERPHFSVIGSEVIFQVQVPDDGTRLARFAYEDIEFGDPAYDFGNSATIGYQESEDVGFQFSFGLVDLAPGDPEFEPEFNVGNGDVVDLNKVPDVDEYTIDLSDRVGQRLDIALAGQEADFSGELLELLDDSGAVLATATANPLGVPADNYDLAVLGFVVPDLGSNVYTLRVSSKTVGDYAMVVTDAVSFESEPNDGSGDPLRNFSDLGKPALGYLSGDEDHFQLNVIAGQTVTVKLQSIFDDPLSRPLNDLDPELIILSSTGEVLATDADSLDGRAAMIEFVAEDTDTITIAAISTSGAGEYLLSAVATLSDGLPAELTIDSIQLPEGDAGITEFSFTITRTHNDDPVLLSVSTSSGTATAGDDFSTLERPVFMPVNGPLTTVVTVNVFGDSDPEGNETFTVNLSNVFGATLAQGTGVGTILDDDVSVRVTGVRVGSSAWFSEFVADLDPVMGLGYAIGTGQDQFKPAPWANLDTIYVHFTADVSDSFTADRVSLVGVNVADYGPLISDVSFDVDTLTGIIRLSERLGNDKLLLGIDDAVSDENGAALDGEWSNGVTVGESGDGIAGGDFIFRFNALPGDVDQDGGRFGGGVGGLDLGAVLLAFFQPIGSPKYTPLGNLDGDDGIGGIDLGYVLNNFFTSLPEGEPADGAFSAIAAMPTVTAKDGDKFFEQFGEGEDPFDMSMV